MRQVNESEIRPAAIVVGCGDVGSAVAHALHRAGCAVVLADHADPPWTRRGMAYTDAWYVGTAELAQVDACFCASVRSIPFVLDRRDMIAATTWSWQGVAAALHPVAIDDDGGRGSGGTFTVVMNHELGSTFPGQPPGVDARISRLVVDRARRSVLDAEYLFTGLEDFERFWKEQGGHGAGHCNLAAPVHRCARTNESLARLVGTGPLRHDLGAVIESGGTKPFEGEPRRVGGAGRERYVYASRAGRFQTNRRIGEHVAAGEEIAMLGGDSIAAPLTGVLRGLSARGARIGAAQKIVEVDPRDDASLCFGLGERPRRIATGVLEALARRGVIVGLLRHAAQRESLHG